MKHADGWDRALLIAALLCALSIGAAMALGWRW